MAKPEYHVVPLKDLKEHKTSEHCWCEPEKVDGVWVHNSADGREEYEDGRRKSH